MSPTSITGWELEEIIIVRCNTCMWQGEEEDLVLFEDEDGLGKGCPKCETDEYLMDVIGDDE